MAAEIPTKEPESINSGDTVQWTKSLADYPASVGWTLAYTFVSLAGETSNSFTFNASASGSDHVITVAATTTAGWIAGEYRGAATATLAGVVKTVWTGLLTVNPNISQSGNVDLRSHAKKCLDAIEAVLEGRATREILNSDVNGVKLERIPLADLLMLRDRYKQEYNRELKAEKIAQGMGGGNSIYVRFKRS